MILILGEKGVQAEDSAESLQNFRNMTLDLQIMCAFVALYFPKM